MVSPQTRKRALTRNRICQHLDLGSAPRTVRYECLLFKPPSTLLQQPELTKPEGMWPITEQELQKAVTGKEGGLQIGRD